MSDTDNPSSDWMHYTEETPCEEVMSRIDNIGQNGNEGLHYYTPTLDETMDLLLGLYCVVQCQIDGKRVDLKRAKLLVAKAKEHYRNYKVEAKGAE